MILIYCILHDQEQPEFENISGVEGQPVFFISRDGLTAAVSEISQINITQDVPRILTYHKVIESLHARYTVIPMRYGCTLNEEFQVTGWLEKNKEPYNLLLCKLEGCVEMGIRALLPNNPDDYPELNGQMAEHENINLAGPNLSPGRAYVAALKKCYMEEDKLTDSQNRLAQNICNQFAGLFRLNKTEFRQMAGERLLSIYFLISKTSAELFRERFQQVNLKESVKLLISGPWPPYNFVMPNQVQKAKSGCME